MENDPSRFTPEQLAATEWTGRNWHDGLKIAGADNNYTAFWAFCAGAEFAQRQRRDVDFVLRCAKRAWVKCPVCGEPDMRCEIDAEGNKLVVCVNHACASNGGTNIDALLEVRGLKT